MKKKMTREEKISLYELLRLYKEEVENEIACYGYPPPETKVEYAALLTAQRHLTCIEEICEVLCYDF